MILDQTRGKLNKLNNLNEKFGSKYHSIFIHLSFHWSLLSLNSCSLMTVNCPKQLKFPKVLNIPIIITHRLTSIAKQSHIFDVRGVSLNWPCDHSTTDTVMNS
jgi:hypothetical protein